MSEAQAENPNQQAQPGAADVQAPAQSAPAQSQPQTSDQGDGGEQTFPIRLVRRETGDTHWNVAKGVYELVRHAETGEPSYEYALLGTVDGVDVTLASFNGGGIDTIVRSQQQAQQGG